MSFFRKTATETTEHELTELQTRRAALAEKLLAVSAEAEQATTARRAFLVDGDVADDQTRKQIDKRVVTAQSAQLGLEDAIAEIDGRIADAEQRLHVQRDQAERATLARDVTTEADDLAAAVARFETAGAAMTAATEALAMRIPNVAPDFSPRVRASILDLSIGARELLDRGRCYATSVASGAAQIRRARPPAPPQPPRAIGPKHEVFLLINASWRDENGTVHTGNRYQVMSMPAATAERAISRGQADDPSSERAQRLQSAFGVSFAAIPADMCVDLDAPAAPVERTLPDGFVERVGPTRTMMIDAGRVN